MLFGREDLHAHLGAPCLLAYLRVKSIHAFWSGGLACPSRSSLSPHAVDKASSSGRACSVPESLTCGNHILAIGNKGERLYGDLSEPWHRNASHHTAGVRVLHSLHLGHTHPPSWSVCHMLQSLGHKICNSVSSASLIVHIVLNQATDARKLERLAKSCLLPFKMHSEAAFL